MSSPSIRNFMSSIDSSPIKFVYDDIDVIFKALPEGEQSIRLENIRGGNTPDYVFIGLIKTAGLNGSSSENCTLFENSDIAEFTLSLNGSGYGSKSGINFKI